MKNTLATSTHCLLSIPEVAWLLGTDNSRVCRAIRVGTLPVVRRGRRLLVPAHALAYLADPDAACAESGRLVGRGDAR